MVFVKKYRILVAGKDQEEEEKRKKLRGGSK